MTLKPDQIRDAVAAQPPLGPVNAERRAAVAMVLLGSTQLEEILFIQRAEFPGDPWSGDVAFPGGGIEAQDRDSRATAERETFEELGLRLPASGYLGTLGEMGGAQLPVGITSHLYHLDSLPELRFNHEVEAAFGVPVPVLRDPGRNRTQRFQFRGLRTEQPIIDLDGYCERVLWGISYRLLRQLFATLGIDTLR